MRRSTMSAGAVALLLLAACSSGTTTDESTPAPTLAPTTQPAVSTVPADTVVTSPERVVLAGAASRSVLPTINGNRDFLADAPGWDTSNPNDPGLFVPAWDQGRIDVGNGSDDSAWVHDDIRTTAVAVQRGNDLVVMANADVYMIFAADAAEITRRARALLPADVTESARIVISATHNHEGPDTAFSINDDWYAEMADQMAAAIAESVANLQPATMSVATDEHRFGMVDGRDPIVFDPRLNVLSIKSAADDATIATVVQWSSHPEVTLNWSPPGDFTEQCAVKGWEGDDCTAEGRYLTADYPGVLRERVQAAIGGEVLYFNGPIGSQIGPGSADIWKVDAEHPIGNGWTAPAGAQPVDGATDLRTRNFARTAAIGEQLALHVVELTKAADTVAVTQVVWSEQQFYTRLSNIGFRVLLADGSLGWQDPPGYTCTAKPFTDETCTSDDGALEDDVLLTPLVDSQIRVADVVKTQLIHVSFGDVGFLFMPGELPPELVVGLPATFNDDPAPFYEEPELHAVGAAYEIPGYLLDLVDEPTTFTVGLGGDELGYWVPINEVRLKCLDLALPSGTTCQQLFDAGLLLTPDAVDGPTCRMLADHPDQYTGDATLRSALEATCRYGQALGRELGEPDGHYEETNSAGWDLVDDLWAAATTLFANSGGGSGINPDNRGLTPTNPPPAG